MHIIHKTINIHRTLSHFFLKVFVGTKMNTDHSVWSTDTINKSNKRVDEKNGVQRKDTAKQAGRHT